jgi:uncharacterized RDD family membrane protein YckC
MEKGNSLFKNYISGLKDERLIEILNIEYSEYTDEALSMVQEELHSRGLVNVIDSKREPNTVRDLILQVKFEDVQRILRREFHINKDVDENYKKVFHQLLSITPSNAEGITIVMDKHYDELTNTLSDWDIYGLDARTEEKFSVDLYNWNDWMSFTINLQNINHVSKELFIACCLFKMTTYGFDSEEIKIKVNEIASSTNMVSNDVYTTDNTDESVIEVHAWMRFWARTIDVMLFTIIFSFFLVYFPMKVLQLIAGINYIMPISLFVWVLVEALLLSVWGKTPGKAIFGMTVSEMDGSKLSFSRALNRSASVWFFGMGCGINIIELIANVTSYIRLSKKGITRWDQNGEYRIIHTKINTVNVIIAVIILVGIPILRYFEILLSKT